MIEQAQRIYEQQHILMELCHLNYVLQANGYSARGIIRAIQPRPLPKEFVRQPAPLERAYLPYIRNVTDRIGKILQRMNTTPTNLQDRCSIFLLVRRSRVIPYLKEENTIHFAVTEKCRYIRTIN